VGCLWHLRRYVVWSRACLCRWGWGPFPGPPGAWHRGAIYAGSAPINLVMLAQTYLHGLVQTLPNAAKRHWHSSHASAASRSYHCRNPRTEASLPWDACLLHEQNAIECCFIAHGELACATFDGRREGGDQGLQLSPQFFANGLSCHEGQKHKCFWLISKESGVSGS